MDAALCSWFLTWALHGSHAPFSAKQKLDIKMFRFGYVIYITTEQFVCLGV